MTVDNRTAGNFDRLALLVVVLLFTGGCATTRTSPDHTATMRAWSSPPLRTAARTSDVRSERDRVRDEAPTRDEPRFAVSGEDTYGLARKSALLMSVNQWLGTPYRYGGPGASGIDCSAFVQSVYDEALGLKLPRTTEQQRESGTKIDASQIGFGDLVFFQISRSQAHVGVVVGPNEFAHASSSSGVIVSRLDDAYWRTRFDRAVRFDPTLAVFEQTRIDPAPRRPARMPVAKPDAPRAGSEGAEVRRGW